MASPRTITLELDEDDWNTIQSEIAKRQAQWEHDPETGELLSDLPEGSSNDVGAILAEVVRDLDEYRALADRR